MNPCPHGLNGQPCNRVRIGEPYDHQRDCRICWRYAHDEAFNLHFGGDGNVTSAPGAQPVRQHPPRNLPEMFLLTVSGSEGWRTADVAGSFSLDGSYRLTYSLAAARARRNPQTLWTGQFLRIHTNYQLYVRLDFDKQSGLVLTLSLGQLPTKLEQGKGVLSAWERADYNTVDFQGRVTLSCGLSFTCALTPASPEKPNVQNDPIGHGPGTELTQLLQSLGIDAHVGCDCKQKARQMNEWGVEGCKARRDEITEWLRGSASKRGWMDKLKAAALAVTKGVAFQLHPADLYGSLVDLAILRAEKPRSE